MVQAIIFDCFGVLITDGLQALLDARLTNEPSKVKEVVEVVKLASKGLISGDDSSRQVAGILGISVEAYRREMAAAETKNTALLQYIGQLHKTYKTALLSNISRGGLLARFAPGELERYFDTTVASSDIGFAKPEPEAYEVTASRLGERLDACVFIDDRADYCDAARAVGMQAVLYENLAQLKRALAGLLNDSKK